jgi:hypothetical protein
MAARKNPKIDAAHRERIATSQLVNRLNKIANGELTVDPIQLRAIEIALRKTLPDLSAVEHVGDALQPFAVIPQQMDSSEAWERAQQAPQPKPDRPKPGTTKH